MSSADQLRRELARLRDEEAKLGAKRSKHETDAAKARADARKKRDRADSTSSPSSSRMYARDAERLEKKASSSEKQAADLAKKLAANSKKQAATSRSLDTALRGEERRRERDDKRRRADEERHARDLAQMGSELRDLQAATSVPAPKPELLRILYLTASPELGLRLDVEVKRVREAVRRALHRDLVQIEYRPAATPEDLIDGINDVRPHVVHFSGHAGGGSVLFDDAEIERSAAGEVGRTLTLEFLARVISATDDPPVMLVLNACDSLEGASDILAHTPVVVGMTASITDLAAAVFAPSFYAAIASAQSVASALEQAKVSIELNGLDESWNPEARARPDVDLAKLVLVRATDDPS